MITEGSGLGAMARFWCAQATVASCAKRAVEAVYGRRTRGLVKCALEELATQSHGACVYTGLVRKVDVPSAFALAVHHVHQI